eukprot:TRINITY_DN9756_c0_g1_i1.p1 TRINITY_DN9756_c0_g1~~TRINITY_DN9756_c0_g1_i1.p1  ORF type:complete len:331 (+),score=91.95 TRINITY_DN9756_c0_g1_i1:64-1056(+)
MQCSALRSMLLWLLAIVPVTKASFLTSSSSLRIPQPWHPHLARVRLPDGSLGLEKRSTGLQEDPILLQVGSEKETERCNCDQAQAEKPDLPSGTSTMQDKLPAQVQVAAPMQQQVPLPPLDLNALKQSESVLEQEEAKLHQQVLLAQQRVQQAEQASGKFQVPAASPQMPQPAQWQALQQLQPVQWQAQQQFAQQGWPIQPVYAQMPMQAPGTPNMQTQPQQMQQMAGSYAQMPMQGPGNPNMQTQPQQMQQMAGAYAQIPMQGPGTPNMPTQPQQMQQMTGFAQMPMQGPGTPNMPTQPQQMQQLAGGYPWASNFGQFMPPPLQYAGWR